MTGVIRRRDSAALSHIMTHQVCSKGHAINGALPGSLPVTGNYLRLAFPNWGMKFYIDALLAV